MDDLISRQAAIDMIEKYFDGLPIAVHHDMLAMIHRLPSVQPEIIRCKDCKYSEHWYRDKRRCFLWAEDGIDVFDDGFCNYAKRRTNG